MHNPNTFLEFFAVFGQIVFLLLAWGVSFVCAAIAYLSSDNKVLFGILSGVWAVLSLILTHWILFSDTIPHIKYW